ncbi:putative chitin synthase III catalytic subunit [Lyophyllum shimeji]|uniref:Chitin synthase III catalytic subunit n=1 Tax=Lyophyllum shimeji TaxID=47721 RepID=A0A9P3UPV8_LYOSH|nr:putative chitin synthase III catalytic subunit [Lyophyllum shimeji]
MSATEDSIKSDDSRPEPSRRTSDTCNSLIQPNDQGTDVYCYTVCAADADVTFVSSDDVLFHVHKRNLEIAAAGFPPAGFDASGEIVPLTESAATLELLFQYVYPRRHPYLEDTPFEVLSPLAEAAEKYQVFAAMNICRIRMSNTLPNYVAEVFNYAYRHGYVDVVRTAVPFLLDVPLDEVVKKLSAHLIVPWVCYREAWSRAALAALGTVPIAQRSVTTWLQHSCFSSIPPFTHANALSSPSSPSSARSPSLPLLVTPHEMTRFGDFAPLCTSVPSYPWCNLFYRQLQRAANSTLVGDSADPRTAGVGINPKCFIPPTFSPTTNPPSPHLGNIANIIACALSLLLTLALIYLAHRRKAAVGRIELRTLLGIYAISLPLNAITTGAFLEQGSTALVVLTAIHAGVVAAFFWALLANAVIATQVVEDGTWSSLVPYSVFSLLIFGLGTYLSLDTALGVTTTIGAPSDPPEALRSISLFVVLSIWPLVCVVLYFALMAYIVLQVLHEQRPMVFYTLSALLFVLSQLAWFLLGRVLCTASDQKVDGAFLATVLETAAITVFFLAWRSITEGELSSFSLIPTSVLSTFFSFVHAVFLFFVLRLRAPTTSVARFPPQSGTRTREGCDRPIADLEEREVRIGAFEHRVCLSTPSLVDGAL